MKKGRKPRKETRADKRINIGLTENEKAIIEWRALTINMTPGAFMRFMALHATLSIKMEIKNKWDAEPLEKPKSVFRNQS